MFIDLDAPSNMDNTSTHPNSEVWNVDNASDNQQVGDVTNTATTLVVRKEKEVESSLDKTPVYTGPLWLENTLSSKKRNIVLVSVPLGDMVSKFLGKTPKAKKLKTISKIDFDDNTSNWTIKIACPNTNEVIASPTAKGFYS